MIKKVLLTAVAAIVLVGGGVLFGSAQSGASSNWTNELASKANAELGKIGFAKKEEIVNKDLTSVMGEAIDPKLKEEQAELEAMMEEYYQMRIDGLTETQAYYDLEKQIENIKLQIFNRYKSEIDAVFTK